MDEFGAENFKTDVVAKRYTRSNNTVDFTSVVEHILVCTVRSIRRQLAAVEQRGGRAYTNPDNDHRGPGRPRS